MKALYTFIFWVLLSSFMYAQDAAKSIRYRFENASSKQDFEWIIQAEVDTKNSIEENIINSYKAVSKSALAQYVFSPYTKFKYFFNGRDQLENCIAIHKNIENVFLRLVVQLSIPVFLGYSENIEEDLSYITNNMRQSNVPMHTKQFIVNTIIKTENSNYDLKSLLDINLE